MYVQGMSVDTCCERKITSTAAFFDEDELRVEEERERGVRAEELGKAWGERDASDV